MQEVLPGTTTFALLDAQFQQLCDGEEVIADPALSEFMRWKHGEPLMYKGAWDMPDWVWRGFSHLCRKWGREGKPVLVKPPTQTVLDKVAELQQHMNRIVPGSQSLPIMHGQ